VSLRRLPSLGTFALLAIGIALLFATRDPGDGERAGHGRGGDRGERERDTARVVSVTDGDTIRVRLAGGEERVRYIGIDTPESAIPGEPPECFGKAAARFNRQLVAGRRVTLIFGAERRDRYGRLLAYVHAGDRFVNAAIVRAGYARTLEIAPNTDFADQFARLQQVAANAGRGLWAAC
jgi:micrococcal nuclease